jgi:hypothetical protein
MISTNAPNLKVTKIYLEHLIEYSQLMPLYITMNSQEETKDPYGAIQFGEFRKYMQNKQSKLKKQQREL